MPSSRRIAACSSRVLRYGRISSGLRSRRYARKSMLTDRLYSLSRPTIAVCIPKGRTCDGTNMFPPVAWDCPLPGRQGSTSRRVWLSLCSIPTTSPLLPDVIIAHATHFEEIRLFAHHVPGIDAGPGGGLVGRIMGWRGAWLKSKSLTRLPSWDADPGGRPWPDRGAARSGNRLR